MRMREKRKQQQLLWNIAKVNHTWIIFFQSKKQYQTKKNILKAIGRTDRITNGTKSAFSRGVIKACKS